MTPDVSVVVPTHNRIQYLKQAIASCFEENDSVNVEVIVVNDGSSDGTRSYLDELDHPHVHPIHQSSQGAQVARNAGMEAARGRYVKFLDDDDWLPPGSLAVEVTRLEESGADVCHGRIQIREEGGNGSVPIGLAPETRGKDIAATILREGVWTVPHKYLFGRDAIHQCTWDPDLPYHQDYAFLVEVACRGAEFSALDRVVGVSRRHDGTRIADTKTDATRADYYTLKVNLIMRGVRRLQEKGLLTDERRRAAAEGIWNWAHIVAGFDLRTFNQFYDEIERLVPQFTPERSRQVFAVLDSIFGVRGAEQVVYPYRRVKNMLQQPHSR
jgi:glycosyltransferase involved in cell wall biosynthesis